ncbi:hypothetical protein [Halolamina litorea]|uniref:SPW repeat-containing protein n=1 Tax=Halolamina litorea TaxID=1515593 RepID=A0ABD6BRT5_9EURY|nr:hypothetical protein [Halolamina litorea]
MVSTLRRFLATVVYGLAVLLGGSLLVPSPTHPLIAVPVLAGGASLVHAVETHHLDELGYAIAGMWAAVLALSVSAGVVGTVGGGLDPLVSVPLASVLGTVAVAAVLVAGYLVAVRRADGGSLSDHG